MWRTKRQTGSERRAGVARYEPDGLERRFCDQLPSNAGQTVKYGVLHLANKMHSAPGIKANLSVTLQKFSVEFLRWEKCQK